MATPGRTDVAITIPLSATSLEWFTELEEMSRAYMAEQKKSMVVWAPNRRAEVAAAMAAEAARQDCEMLDEDDFNPLPDDELSGTEWDEDGETLTEVAEEWA